MTIFVALGAGWYALNAGMQTLSTVALTPDELALRYAFRQILVDMAQIGGAEIVGPEAFSPTIRFFLGLRATRCRRPSRTIFQ